MQKISLSFEKLSMFNREKEPCMVAVPFPQGSLIECSKAAIYDGERQIPSQSRATALWPDKSVKWLLVNFLADLPGNASKKFSLKMDSLASTLPEKPVSVEKQDGRLVIATDGLKVGLASAGETGVFNYVKSSTLALGAGDIKGPAIYDAKGVEWVAEIGQEGWEVIEPGPVRVVVEAKGKHRSKSGAKWFDYVLRIYAFAGKPWVRADYQIINREKEAEQVIKGMELELGLPGSKLSEVDTALAISNYMSKISCGEGEEKLSYTIDANHLLYESNEQFPETLYGTFWADINEKGRGGVCATIFQAHQNYPKAFEVDGKSLKMGLVPFENQDIHFLQGMAKTQRFFLHFHSADEAKEILNIRSLQFQMPDRPTIDTEVYENSRVFESLLVEKKVDEIERTLINLADVRMRAYGMMHWGDTPDMGYTEQGRGKGELVWTNNEYDFPHAAMLSYARTSARRMLDYMLVAAEHWKDVDVCHFSEDPLKFQGQVMHSARHVTGPTKPCHEWVEGLLDYYHQTGEYSAYEAAIGIGENVLRLLKEPRYKNAGGINARETGWALRTLGALYKETYEKKWIEASDKIADQFQDWKEKYGAWLSPYTDHAAIRVPFMISVAVNSLMRYYKVNPQPRIKDMIVAAMDDLLENALLENGLFYYKELPSLQRLGNNPIVLEALTYAYDFTGDKKYLEAGMPTFDYAVKTDVSIIGGSKEVVGDAVIYKAGPGTKRFAQYFYPILYFYRAASKAGILKG